MPTIDGSASDGGGPRRSWDLGRGYGHQKGWKPLALNKTRYLDRGAAKSFGSIRQVRQNRSGLAKIVRLDEAIMSWAATQAGTTLVRPMVRGTARQAASDAVMLPPIASLMKMFSISANSWHSVQKRYCEVTPSRLKERLLVALKLVAKRRRK